MGEQGKQVPAVPIEVAAIKLSRLLAKQGVNHGLAVTVVALLPNGQTVALTTTAEDSPLTPDPVLQAQVLSAAMASTTRQFMDMLNNEVAVAREEAAKPKSKLILPPGMGELS